MAPVAERRFVQDGRPRRVHIRLRIVTNSVAVAIAHVLGGGGLTLALAYQVADAGRTGALVTVLEAFEPEPSPIQLVRPAGSWLPARVRAFTDLVAGARDWKFVRLGRA